MKANHIKVLKLKRAGQTKTTVIALIVALMSVALAGSALAAGTQDSRYSSKPWVPLKKIETAEQLKNLPGKAQIAMACAKCKSVLVAIKRDLTTKPGRGTTEEVMVVDQCPGCGGKMVARGDKQTQMVHTCSKCGDGSAFCCATRPGDKPTPGMEKKGK